MKTIIIYHRDLDGLASALIARKKYPKADMISVQHGEEFKLEKDYDTIIMVDFSVNEYIMAKMNNETKEFIWIDHHKSAKEKLSDLWNSKFIKGIRSTKKAACELTWDYFYPKLECPYAIRLIGDRDTWTWKYKDNTKHFNLYLDSYALDDPLMWEELDIFIGHTLYIGLEEEHMDNCCEEGKVIERYKDTLIKRIYDGGSIDKSEDGYKEYMLESPIFKSDISDYVFKKHPEVEITRIKHISHDDTSHGTKSMLNVGLYSRGNVDVSKIAIENQGGGHFCAAGYFIRLGRHG